KYLGGILPDTARPGFRHFVIAPKVVRELSWVKSTTRSIYGLISSSWEKKGDSLHFSIAVPGNTSALVVLPASSAGVVREGGKALEEAPGLRLRQAGAGEIVLEALSGKYDLSLPWKDSPELP
ncbi:MAG TPA: alpha-L-rhamnosidase C-terminal domain-containing protein, partial [Anseongella sp.]|nr:alpha-L-rhamnosidase C-terminal domain-containing protein [Anseongella sp.]